MRKSTVKKKTDVSFRKKDRPKTGSKYEWIFNDLRDLKRDEVLLLSPPDDLTCRQYKNMVWAAMLRAGLHVRGRKYKTRLTDSGCLAIMVK
jgi:hypothetical protein